MDIDKLREEIEYDEGNVKKYILTIWGCLLLALAILLGSQTQNMDGKWAQRSVTIDVLLPSTKISKLSCQTATNLYPDFEDLPEEVKRIIANMMFNMGRPRLSKFKGMKAGVDARDWNKAADEMVDSRWYRQVTKRADRLVERMRNV